MESGERVAVGYGEALARYGFGDGHPFGPDRQGVWWSEMASRGTADRVLIIPPRQASRAELLRFHDADYVERVRAYSDRGYGMLDRGDTPAFPGVYEAASTVVGTVLDAAAGLVEGRWSRAFVGVAGLHHARRNTAGGFCVFNDIGVALETLLGEGGGVERIAYVDIDAHHGDGVFYPFIDRAGLFIADVHQDGRTLFPGTGFSWETGKGAAKGNALNIPLQPGAGDETFFAAWEKMETHVDAARPELIVLQCGADSLAGDPITMLEYSRRAHRHATERLIALADRHASGRLLCVGGGGYDRKNLAEAWTDVVDTLLG